MFANSRRVNFFVANSIKNELAIMSRKFSESEENKSDIVRSCICKNKNPVEAILFLYSKFSLDLLMLMVSYWDFKFDLDVKEFDLGVKERIALSPTINMCQKWLFFNKDLLASKAANHVAWGSPQKIEKIIKNYPYVMLIDTKASDHIGTLSGTLYEIALQLNDTLIQDAKGRTMTEMIESHLKINFGEQEVKKQKDRVIPLLKQREEKNLVNREEDKNAFLAVWQALSASTATDENTFGKDQNLIKAFAAYERQLITQGDWMILVDAAQLYGREYYNLGGCISFKIKFYENKIMGTIELSRLRAWELQLLGFGIANYKDGAVVPRIDIRFWEGLDPVTRHRLGFKFWVNTFGNQQPSYDLAAYTGPEYEAQHFRQFFSRKNSKLAEFISSNNTHPRASPTI